MKVLLTRAADAAYKLGVLFSNTITTKNIYIR